LGKGREEYRLHSRFPSFYSEKLEEIASISNAQNDWSWNRKCRKCPRWPRSPIDRSSDCSKL